MRAVLARGRVQIGFICGVLALVLATPSAETLAAGAVIALAGEGVRIWAAGHLEKGREVTSSGPYRITRHPLYMGSAIIALGAAIAAARLSAAVLVFVYLIVTILPAIRGEEGRMRASFGDQYDAYVKSIAVPVDRPFSLSRAMTNKEYR